MSRSLSFWRLTLPGLLLIPSISFAQVDFGNLPEEVINRNIKAWWDCSHMPENNENAPGECTWNKKETASSRQLAKRRIQERKENLHSGYKLDKYPDRDHPCTAEEKKYRTADGSCNDEEVPLAGTAGARFGRITRPESAHPETGDRLLTPNPRKISLELLTRKEFKPVDFLNLFATAWIQFMIHDWFDHGEPDPDMSQAYQLEVDPNDPWKNLPGVSLAWSDEKKSYYTYVPRTREDLSMYTGPGKALVVPATPHDGRGVPASAYKTHQNTVTAWWDLSQIYGSDLPTQMELRSGQNGQMRVRDDGLLPVKTYSHNGRPALVEQSGFTKNWWLGLSLLHHLFVREHNHIAEQLAHQPETMRKKGESDKDFDQRIFQVARLINSAVMAKIHTNEWTPAILANVTMYWGMNGNWYGYNRDRGNAETFGEKFFRIFDPMLLRFDKRNIQGATGRVGEKAENYGTTYTFPEEFVSVYRMHPLLPDTFKVRDARSGLPVEDIKIANLRDTDTTKLIYGPNPQDPNSHGKYSMTDLMYSMGVEHPGQLVLDNYPNVLQNIMLPVRDASDPNGHKMYPMDLASIDVLRDRERGVPRYNQFRRTLHLKPIPDFRWLSPNKDVVERLRKAYNNKIEDLDLFVGAMAEDPSYRPAGFGFSETLFQLFVLTASRRLETDKFFTKKGFNEKTYTKWGFRYINGANKQDEGRSMSAIIRTHFPQLGNALQGKENPFRPWNEPKGAAL